MAHFYGAPTVDKAKLKCNECVTVPLGSTLFSLLRRVEGVVGTPREAKNREAPTSVNSGEQMPVGRAPGP